MIRLHGYWRSGTSYRTRLALAIKGIAYQQATHDLRAGAQHDPAYRALNPQGLVPALETADGVLIQSPAILEWLDEAYPAPPLLPADVHARAIVRGMAAIIGCDIHPLNNLRVLDALRRDLGADKAQVLAWSARWIAAGFDALEPLVARHGAGFGFGGTVGLVDCYLLPQVYSAERFVVDLSPYPRIVAAAAAVRSLPALAAAHPETQPDADPA